MKNDPILQEIKDRLSVVDVLSGYVQVKKSGSSYKALCPFHHERTPSLQLSPAKQIWHCFGCGEGGDIFSFVKKYENLEFKDALKLLADRAGVKLPQYKPENQGMEDQKTLLYKINDFAARFYHQTLMEGVVGKAGLRYLAERGLTKETLVKWQIGFAPADFQALRKALEKKVPDIQNGVKAGVLVKNEKGQIYDRFRGRITFPIFDYFGRVVGFSARILPELDVPTGSQVATPAKYINSPETLIYNKSRTIFGLNFAKNEIRKKDEALVVEGQMDCIAAHQAGFQNTLASSGTAFTDQAIEQLSRLTKNLKLCFDQDEAGLTATKKTVERLMETDFALKVVVLQKYKDPDEALKKDPDAFSEAVKNASLFLDFYIERLFAKFGNTNLEAKKHISKEILPLLSRLSDPLETEHYVQSLAYRLGVKESAILKKISEYKAFSSKNSQARKPEESKTTNRGHAQENTRVLLKKILGGATLDPEFRKKILEIGTPEDFLGTDVGSEILFIWGGADKNNSDGSFVKEAEFMVELKLKELAGDRSVLYKELVRDLSLYLLQNTKKRQYEIEKLMRQAEAENDKEQVLKLNQIFLQLNKRRSSLEKEFI